MNTRLKLNGLLVGAALLAVSCSGLKTPGGSSTRSSNDASTAKASTQASGDPREDLKKAFTAQLAAKSFRYRLEFSFASGGHADAEFVAPDRYHITIIGQSSMPGNEMRQEMVIIGKDTFMKIANMPWQRTEEGSGKTTMATTIARMAQQFRNEDVAQRMMKYEDVKFVSSEVLDGSPTLVYQFKLKGTEGQTTPGKIWISATDDLPRKIEQGGSSATNPDGTSKSKLIVTYYDYNANIKIEPPI